MHPSDPYIWETIVTQWNLNNAIDANCASCNGQLISWYDDLLKNDSKIKIAQYSSYEDGTIRMFLDDIPGFTFQNHLLATTNDLYNKYPEQYKRFLIAGESHCLFPMEARDYSIGGQSYWDWVLAFVNEDASWQDILE